MKDKKFETILRIIIAIASALLGAATTQAMQL